MREMTLLCITATLLVAVMAELSSEEVKRIDAQHKKFDKLTAGIVNLNDDLHHRQEERERANLLSQAMWGRLDKKFGGSCKKGQYKCGTSTHCIDLMLCCDGESDCDNGADEVDSLCKPKISIGTKWEGRFVYYTCNQEKLTEVGFELTKFDKKPDLKGFADVKGILHWTDETNSAHKMAEQLPYDGIYSFGSRNADFRVDYHGETYHEHLFFYAGEAENLYYDIMHAATGDICGKAIMTRQH